MWPQVSALEKQVDELMARAGAAGNDHAGRAAALEEYLQLARVHQDDDQFEVGAWSEELADSYLALGRVDDAVRTIRNATEWGYGGGRDAV